MIRVGLKLLGIAAIVVSFCTVGVIIGLITWNKLQKRKLRNKSLQFFSKLALQVLQIKVNLQTIADAKHSSHLIISNHTSYVDVIVLAARAPYTFVTSKEIEADPFLGSICRFAGCVFVERRKIRQLYQEIEELSVLLDQGISIVIFPEATSSNGSLVLPFKRALLEAAFRTQKNLLPFCINIMKANGAEIGAKERDAICYYGEMGFVPHIIRLSRLKAVEINLVQLSEIDLQSFSDSKELSQFAYDSISGAHKPLVA